MSDKKITYVITTSGDPSVGIAGDYAEVTFFDEWESAEDCDAARRSALAECFAAIMDGKVRVEREGEVEAVTGLEGHNQ